MHFLVAGIGALLLLWLAVRLLRLLRAMPASGTPVRALRRQARRARAAGDCLAAGRLYEQAGEWEAAAVAYETGQGYAHAARLRERQNRLAAAAALYEQAGDCARAGELYARLGSFGRAAALLEKGGQDVKAAEALERAGELERAALLYAKYDVFERAGELRSRLRQPAAAAELLERALAQRRVRAAAGDALALEGVRRLARRTAELYAAAGRASRAAVLLREHGLDDEAAERYCQAGEWQAGLELLLRHQHFDRAAELCRSRGLTEQLYLVEAERALADGREADAARAFQAAGAWWRAGEMYQRTHAFREAAAMFARQGDEERAAEMHVAAGEPAAAAAALERLGRREDAARYYREAGALGEAARVLREAGDFLGSAEALVQAGGDAEAIRLLQQVPPDSPRHPAALLRLAELFVAQGLEGPAREKLEQALPLLSGGRAAVRAAYQLGLIHERQGNAADALRCFERVLAEHVDYEDVQMRVADLRMRQAEALTQLLPTPAPRYRIQAELGRGGMGIVYRAEDTLLRRTVAYKVLSEVIHRDAGAMEAFLEEARIAASLHHANIVTIYDAGHTASQAYIAMEFVEGRSLQEILETEMLPASRALAVFRQACLGLTHAHEREIVHRDVKPANMMVRTDGVVKLTDFGLAAVATQAMGRVTSVRGTPFYMAPEQIRGGLVSAQADQYSLGCTLYHALTGHPPFVDGDVLFHHLHTEPTSIRVWQPGLPGWLDRIVLRMLQKHPEQRYPALTETLVELDARLADGQAPEVGDVLP